MRNNKLILGTVQFGLDYGINNAKGKPSNSKIKQILDYAYKFGVNMLDTAEAYGDSQEKIGEYHKKTNNKFSIITKYSKFRTDLPENISERVKHNLDILNVDSIYCYMFHNFKDFDMFFNLFKDDLLNLKKNGFIKKIGVSLHSNDEINKVMCFKEIDVIQLPFNLLDNGNQRELVLLKAKRIGIEIHTRSVFLQGLFFKDTNKLTGNLVELKEDLKKIVDIVPRESINDLALNYVYSKPYVDGILVGVDSVSQLKSNIDCVEENRMKNVINKIDFINVKEIRMLNPVNWLE